MTEFGHKIPEYKPGMLENAVSDQFTPGAAPYEVVQVTLDVRGLTPYVDALYERMQADLGLQGGGATIDLSYEEMMLYVKTLLSSRIRYSVGWGRGQGREPVVKYNDASLVVPVFLAEVLENVGRVILDSVGIELVPVDPYKNDELLDVDQFRAVCRKLRRLERFGWVFAKAYKRKAEGDASFMSMQCVDGMVRSHTDRTPLVKAVFAYFLGMVQTRILLGHRIEYCHYSEANTLMLELTARY